VSNLTLFTSRSVADYLYSAALSSAYRSAWVYDPSFATAREPDLWEVIRNDVDIDGAIERSGKSIIRPWRVESFDGSRDPADQQIAAVVKDALGHIEGFNPSRRIISEARFLGRRYGAILWWKKRVVLGGLSEMDWWVPYQVKDIDRRRFHWVTDWDKTHTNKTGVHLEMYNTNSGRWERLAPELEKSLIQFTVNDTEDRVGNGRGSLECLYFAHYLKTMTYEKISQGIDRWANGIAVLELDSLRGASDDKANDALVLAAKNMLNDIRSEHVAVIGEGDKLKILETSGTGHQISIDFLRLLIESMERRINGSVRPFGHNVGGTGSRAASETESDTSEGFFQDDRDQNDAIMNRDLVGAFMRINQPTLESAGLGRARRPRFTSEQIKRQDPKEAVLVMNEAIKYVGLSRREYFEKIGCTDPEGRGEQVIGPFPQGGLGGAGGDGADWRDMGLEEGNREEGKTRKTFGYAPGVGWRPARFEAAKPSEPVVISPPSVTVNAPITIPAAFLGGERVGQEPKDQTSPFGKLGYLARMNEQAKRFLGGQRTKNEDGTVKE
jgi:hypothetical protein